MPSDIFLAFAAPHDLRERKILNSYQKIMKLRYKSTYFIRVDNPMAKKHVKRFSTLSGINSTSHPPQCKALKELTIPILVWIWSNCSFVHL